MVGRVYIIIIILFIITITIITILLLFNRFFGEPAHGPPHVAGGASGHFVFLSLCAPGMLHRQTCIFPDTCVSRLIDINE